MCPWPCSSCLSPSTEPGRLPWGASGAAQGLPSPRCCCSASRCSAWQVRSWWGLAQHWVLGAPPAALMCSGCSGRAEGARPHHRRAAAGLVHAAGGGEASLHLPGPAGSPRLRAHLVPRWPEAGGKLLGSGHGRQHSHHHRPACGSRAQLLRDTPSLRCHRQRIRAPRRAVYVRPEALVLLAPAAGGTGRAEQAMDLPQQ